MGRLGGEKEKGAHFAQAEQTQTSLRCMLQDTARDRHTFVDGAAFDAATDATAEPGNSNSCDGGHAITKHSAQGKGVSQDKNGRNDTGMWTASASSHTSPKKNMNGRVGRD